MPLRTLYVDLNSFFASVEQQLNPALRGKPVAVVPMITDTTSVIAASYPAKRFGIKTGTRVGDARRMCPGLILVCGGHGKYIEFHHRVVEAAATVLPVQSVHSIDEFSCRLLGVEREPARAAALAREMKRAIASRVGECLTCSIGIAGNRLLAKMASDMQKPDGLVVLEGDGPPSALRGLTLRDISGVGPKMERRLNRAGVYTMEHLLSLDEGRMREAWGSVVGAWYWRALRGEEVGERATVRRSIGHQHVLSPERRTPERARAVLVRLLDKAAARARHVGCWARRLTVSIRYTRDKPDGATAREGWRASDWSASATFPECHDTTTLVQEMARLWEARPQGGTILMVGVTLSDLSNGLGSTRPLFDDAQRRERLARAVDRINEVAGRAAIYPASMHEARTSAPARIAFSNIPDLDMPHVKESAARDDARARDRNGGGNGGAR
ncbi:MAG: DNA polymerase [Phycisphaerae bacterium]|nr:DNA polymerase [Phycisphaerae bacterium]